EEPLSGLGPMVKRYEEHHTRIITPSKFDKPFVLIFNKDKNGLLLAPNGTPRRVDYIINDLAMGLKINFKKEIRFTPDKMDKLLDKLKKDGDRIKHIDWVSASIIDDKTHEHHNTT